MRISKSDILEALGLEDEGFSAWMGPALVGFGIGALVGASVALMLAPRSGTELREELMERGRRVVERGREKMGSMGSGTNAGERPQS